VILTKTALVETFDGACMLRLRDRTVSLRCVLRLYQDYDTGVPTLKHGDGKFLDLLRADEAVGEVFDMELDDGRQGKIRMNFQGHFKLTGPLR